MSINQIIDTLGEISDDLILDAAPGKTGGSLERPAEVEGSAAEKGGSIASRRARRNRWIGGIAAAACLALVVGLGMGGFGGMRMGSASKAANTAANSPSPSTHQESLMADSMNTAGLPEEAASPEDAAPISKNAGSQTNYGKETIEAFAVESSAIMTDGGLDIFVYEYAPWGKDYFAAEDDTEKANRMLGAAAENDIAFLKSEAGTEAIEDKLAQLLGTYESYEIIDSKVVLLEDNTVGLANEVEVRQKVYDKDSPGSYSEVSQRIYILLR